MSKGKTRPSLVCLCVTVVLATMAFATSGAQAAAWMLGKENVTSDTSVELGITLDGALELLTTASGTKIAIECPSITADNVTLHAGGVASGTLLLFGCATFLKGMWTPSCDPPALVAMELTFNIYEHVGGTYLKATGKEGLLATITLGEEECAVGEEFELTGTLWIVDIWGEAETEVLVHLVQEGQIPAEALGGLYFGTEPAVIDGGLKVELFHEGEMVEFSALG